MKRIAIALAATAVAVGLSSCVLPPEGKHPLSTASSSYGSGGTYTAAPTTTAAALPRAADFRLTIVETSHKCFGSAGCSISFRIDPQYVGSGSPPTGSFTLLYEVIGGDQPQTGSIKVTNGRYNHEEGSLDSDGGTLTARVTQVLED